MVSCQLSRLIHGRITRVLTLLAAFLLLPTLSGAEEAEMVGPLRLVVAPPGLLVGDYVGSQVLVADPETLEITSTLPIYTDETLLVRGKPLSIGWMNNRLYVGEEQTALIQVFEQVGSGKKPPKKEKKPKDKDTDGGAWAQVTSSLTTTPVVQPSAIVADESQGWLFVASKGEKAVLVVDEAGSVIRTIGPGSTAPLGNPQAVALDRDGQRVFVSDDGIEQCSWMGCSRMSAVQVYDYNGTPLGTINGNSGNAGYKFSRAQGVALDAAGNVLLADSYRHEVMVFEEPEVNTWSLLGIIGGKGTAPGKLVLPTGVTVDLSSSLIYVANTMRARVEVFTMEDLAQ